MTHFLTLLFMLALSAPTVFAESAANPMPVSNLTKVENELDSILKLLEDGEYHKAQKGYEQLLDDRSLSTKQQKEVRKGYENLNIKMLFSRTPTKFSEFYTVQEGDSLYKIAKKYNTTIDLIKKSNALKKDTIYPRMKLKVVKGVFSIHVDKSRNELEIQLNGETLKHYSVATGAKNGTPTGKYKITTKLENPTWYKTGAVIEPNSPENGLGTRWLGFDYPGYGIHGTIEPETIGTQSSAGCVRMHNVEVEELFSMVPRGTEVTIVD